MAQDTEYLTVALTGYFKNLEGSNYKDVISAGRAAGLALELDKPFMAQGVWQRTVPVVAGMPTLNEFRAGYEAHPNLFNAFATGEKDKAHFTAPGTRFSNATGSYARALYFAVNAKQLAVGESLEYWAAHWGVQALVSAGFPREAAQLSEAILKGRALETVQKKSPGV
jgi:hypothetical protein